MALTLVSSLISEARAGRGSVFIKVELTRGLAHFNALRLQFLNVRGDGFDLALIERTWIELRHRRRRIFYPRHGLREVLARALTFE